MQYQLKQILFSVTFLTNAVVTLSYTFSSHDSFSLSAYQRARARETAASLDASRLHFQILFVDDDNSKARLSEGLLAKVAEYNDAMFILFPSSSTICNSLNAPRDASPTEGSLLTCTNLGLCSSVSSALGSSFDMSFLDEYDLVVAMNEDILSLILRSLGPDEENQKYYGPKCRLLSEFLSADFYNSQNENGSSGGIGGGDGTAKDLLNMLDDDLRDRASPFFDYLVKNNKGVGEDIFLETRLPSTAQEYNAISRFLMTEKGAMVPNTTNGSWPAFEAAAILATAGLTRFSLDAIDAHFNTEFEKLLNLNFHCKECLEMSWDEVDDRLSRCSASVSGYFSPKVRREKIEMHLGDLEKRLNAD